MACRHLSCQIYRPFHAFFLEPSSCASLLPFVHCLANPVCRLPSSLARVSSFLLSCRCRRLSLLPLSESASVLLLTFWLSSISRVAPRICRLLVACFRLRRCCASYHTIIKVSEKILSFRGICILTFLSRNLSDLGRHRYDCDHGLRRAVCHRHRRLSFWICPSFRSLLLTFSFCIII